MVLVVLMVEKDVQTAGAGGTTRAHTVDERLTTFRELAPAGVSVEMVAWDPDDLEAMRAALAPGMARDAVTAHPSPPACLPGE
eukprot:SAG22_NODE_395_length_11139_cov_14.562500_4_plen_83_part_00